MDFQARVHAFLARHHLAHTPETHALDLASEVGEVSKALLEATHYGQRRAVAGPALESELGDAFYALVTLAESLDVDLSAALDAALARYEARIAATGHSGNPHPGP
ncbi:MAG: MazG-like family protein [Anaerolineae bacterium]|nr:MazG-like family protein [Anaerolineae bacterium]